MIDFSLKLDQSIFLFLNQYHSNFADSFFYLISNRFFWIPLYLLFLFFIIKKERKHSIILIATLILTIFITDQSCNIIKRNTKRLRPSHNTELMEKVHLVTKPDGKVYRGGRYGFPSSHAANSVVFALFMFHYITKGKKWLSIALVVWVLLLSYSRIYLGVHYLSDLIAGWLLGTILSCLSLILLSLYRK